MEEQRLLRSRPLVTRVVWPATWWMRVVSMASARVIASRMVVSRLVPASTCRALGDQGGGHYSQNVCISFSVASALPREGDAY